MSPEEIFSHSRLKGELSRVVATLVKDKKLGDFLPDRVLLINEQAGISTEPDATFVSRESIRSGRVRFVPNSKGFYMSLAGSPDWVAEIVSQTSFGKDTPLLKAAYEQAGVREYWLLDARGRRMEVRVFCLRRGRLKQFTVRSGAWHSPVFDANFQLRREKDEFGHWEYTLDVS